MIYFLDNSLQLQKIVTSKNVISAIHEHELNGLIRGDIELDLSYANKFLVLGIDHVGYYYKDEFYLHKIQRVEYDHVNESAKVVLRHIFFEDMIFGKLIQDVRPQDQDALAVSRQTIDANTRWQTIMTDVTGRLSTNFYWQVPYEVIEFMTENYRIEYLPKILFDGQKINGFQLHLANKIGEDKNIRIPYGSRVLDLKYEEDYSEIITKLVVHGKGEEVGDGYGRRINISDVNFSRNGVESPVGSLYLEDETITNTYGNDGQTPREGREVFEDIEDANELAEAGYQHYLQVSRPQMLFTADVADIGDVGIGDSVMIIRREYDVYFNARIHKLSVDLLYPEDAQVELGDYEHFKESKIARKSREKNNQLHKRNQSLIERAKREFDENFDGAVEQFRSEFEQAKIDIFAEIEADRVNMEALLNTKLTEFNTAFNADMEAAYEDAQRNYTAIEDYVNTTVDSNRGQVEQIINTAEQSAKDYAEQQALAKAEAVRTDLETVTSGHQQMLDDLESSVMNIDDFIGPRDRTLQSILDEQRAEIEQKIEIYNRAYPNLLVGTSLGDITGFTPWQDSEIELRENESLSYIRTYPGTANQSGYEFPDFVYLEQGKTYTIGIDFRSENVEDLDYIYFLGRHNNVAFSPLPQTRGLTADGTWYRYYFTFDWINTSRQAKVMIATNFNVGDMDRDWFDTRQAHVYEGDAHDIPWSPSASDNNQVVNQLLYEVRQLDDGMSTLATKTEVDLLTGNVTQLTNEYHSTSEQVSSKLQNFDDVLGVNGSHFTQIADQVQSKVWLNDVTDINPNLIPFADVKNLSDMSEYWSRFGANPTGSHAIALDSDGFYVFRDTVADSNLALESSTFEEVKEGEQYTLSFLAKTHSNINDNYNYTYIINPNGSNHNLGMWTNRKHIKDNIYLYEWIFEARWTGAARVLIGSTTTSGTDANIRFKEPKLERGTIRTPFLNAFSNIEQLANKIAMQVQELDGEYLSQSDIEIKPGYVQLGSQRLGDSQLASIFRVSPNSIEAITDRMILNGDLYVDGDITALAVSAINAEFSDLFAARVRAGSVHADYVEGFSARFESLYTLDANIERLVAQHVFTDAVTTKSLAAIEANIGRVRTAFLTSNVIESDHISVGTALVDKMFATSARIDELITKSHFVTNVKAMSIEAVDGQFSSLMTKYLSANYIDVDYINGKNAWFESQYTLNANIAKLTAQTAFIRDIQAIEITANQLSINTLHSKLRGTEGGLTIYGPDGRVLINNSILENTFSIQFIQPRFEGVGVELSANYYKTTNTSYTTAAAFSYQRGGRYLTVEGYCEMRGEVSGAATTTQGNIRLLEYSSGSRSSFTTIESRGTNNGGNQFFRIRIDMGVPQYEQRNFYVQFRTLHSGNAAYFRINQAYYHG